MVLFDYGFDSLINFVFNFPIMPPTTRRSAAFFLQKKLHVCKTFCIFAVVKILFPPFYIYVKMHVPPRRKRWRHFLCRKFARLQIVSYICGELSSIFRFLMQYLL